MPKKLDRFERKVEKHVYADQWNIPVINASRATKLLRAENEWMLGMVGTVASRTKYGDSSDYRRGVEALAYSLLCQLRKCRK